MLVTENDITICIFATCLLDVMQMIRTLVSEWDTLEIWNKEGCHKYMK